MRALFFVAKETFILLRRDRIFLPGLLAAIGLSIFATIAAEWGADDFEAILFNIGFFGFQMMGGMIAVFWSIKAITDSRQDGALEVQLAAPIPRTTWLVGKFAGLSLALTFLGATLLAAWQGLMLLAGYTWLRPIQLAAFGFLVLSWLILAALGVALAAFLRQGVALFSAICLWIVGLAASLVAHTLPEEANAGTKVVVTQIARLWDMQLFNLTQYAARETTEVLNLGWRLGYGVILIVALLSAACMIFRNRDII